MATKSVEYIFRTLLPLFVSGFWLTTAVAQYQTRQQEMGALSDGFIKPMRSKLDECQDKHRALAKSRRAYFVVLETARRLFADAITGPVEHPSISSRLDKSPRMRDFPARVKKEMEAILEQQDAMHRCYRDLTRIAADSALLRGDRDNYDDLTKQANSVRSTIDSEEDEVYSRFMGDIGSNDGDDFIVRMEKVIEALSRLSNKGADIEHLSEEDASTIMVMLTRTTKFFDELSRLELRSVRKQEARFAHEISKSVEAFVERQKRSAFHYLWPR
jgi:hypothetical protein